MAERKGLSKRLRFAVFERDNFCCQYCGRMAPEVILVVDHVMPVAKGGSNEFENLTTSCFECNSGKSDTVLSCGHPSERAPLTNEQLAEQREQLERLLLRQEESRQLHDAVLERLERYWLRLAPGYGLSPAGRHELSKTIRRFGASNVISSMSEAADYLEWGNDQKVTSESWDKAFLKIGAFCQIKDREQEEPWLRDLCYIRGILRRRLSSFSVYREQESTRLLEWALTEGVDPETVKKIAKRAWSWSRFVDELMSVVEEYQSNQQ